MITRAFYIVVYLGQVSLIPQRMMLLKLKIWRRSRRCLQGSWARLFSDGRTPGDTVVFFVLLFIQAGVRRLKSAPGAGRCAFTPRFLVARRRLPRGRLRLDRLRPRTKWESHFTKCCRGWVASMRVPHFVREFHSKL